MNVFGGVILALKLTKEIFSENIEKLDIQTLYFQYLKNSIIKLKN